MNVNVGNHTQFILLAAFLSAFAGPARAAVIAFSSVAYDEGDFSGLHSLTDASGSTSSASYSSSTVTLATSASGHAEYGGLHANAFSGTLGPGTGARTQAKSGASAVWIDNVTIGGPGLTGWGYAHASFSLSGGLDVHGLGLAALGNSTIGAAVRVDGSPVLSIGGQLTARDSAIVTDLVTRGVALNGVFETQNVSDLTGTFSFDIPFQFGVSFQLFASLNAETQALAFFTTDDASASSNFGSSGYWSGISGVRLSTGEIVSDYSLTSDSGFDWRQSFKSQPDPVSVPAPGSVWLLGSAMAGFLAVRKRKPLLALAGDVTL